MVGKGASLLVQFAHCPPVGMSVPGRVLLFFLYALSVNHAVSVGPCADHNKEM